MRGGWDRRRLRRAAGALMALTLIPIAAYAGSVHALAAAEGVPGSLGGTGGPTRALDMMLPMTDAVRRGEASSLFAPFTWDGRTASGPFVQFDYRPSEGQIVGYFATGGPNASLLANTITVSGFAPLGAPVAWGSTFIAAGESVTLVAHDEPMALLEIESEARPQTVLLGFPSTTTALQLVHGATWPRWSLAFTVGRAQGRLILGRGNLTVNGTTARAELAADDYLALRALPSFVGSLPERSEVLDAFASGRLAAEYSYVAIANGGWLENSAEYQPGISVSSSSVSFSRATLALGPIGPAGGLVLVAFDPATMPADARHRLTVTADGIDIPEAESPLASLQTPDAPPGPPAFALLPMNATVLAISLPNMTGTELEIRSTALPRSVLDWPTELAMVAAAFVVSVAAAIMFRRPMD